MPDSQSSDLRDLIKNKIRSISHNNDYSRELKRGSITVLLTSCFTGLESAVGTTDIFLFIYKTDKSKPVRQEVNTTVQ
jgi:hypothetical protein